MDNRRGSKMTTDRMIKRFDKILRIVTGQTVHKRRDLPGSQDSDLSMKPSERRVAGKLMRVNHSGEMCAQALYLGQSFFSREESTFDCLSGAALEEADHLYWCTRRLEELEAKPSKLNPIWVTGSCVMGVFFGLAGDSTSLGFVEETEKQVVEHLNGHLRRLPKSDLRSYSIINVMLEDEAMHATRARAHGGKPLPKLLRRVMALQARVMTTVSYKL